LTFGGECLVMIMQNRQSQSSLGMTYRPVRSNHSDDKSSHRRVSVGLAGMERFRLSRVGHQHRVYAEGFR
jgi:hypothetical protein